MQTEILVKTKREVPQEKIKSLVGQISEDLGLTSSHELTILFCDDAEISALNKKFRFKDGATDVLSFCNEEETPEMFLYLGDLVVSLETAERQAKEAGISEEEEIFSLVIHGVLHLVGYEHEGVDVEVAEHMYSLQRSLLEKFLTL